MSGRKQIAVKSGIIGLMSQSASLILQIISRKVFIQFIGEEILGLNGTFASVLSTLSLAELGFQNAVSFHLYRPVAEKNEKEISDIVNIYKTIYRMIGIFFCVASVLLLPFLKYILKDIDATKDIYIFFLLQAMSSTCTYFLAYRRTILYADQKEYIYRVVDTIMNFVFKTAQIVVIVTCHSYVAYLLLQIVQVYASNIIIHCICRKKYPFIKKEPFNKAYARRILKDVKEISIGRLASYVYSSTDNLLISSFVGTVKVAGLGNYTTITTNLRMLINSILSPMIPIIGNYLTENEANEHQEKKFNIYLHLRYLITIVLLVPTFVLIDDFVSMWIGKRYILSSSIKVLLIADLFLTMLQGVCTDYISAKGLFKQNRHVLSISTGMNLGISLLLVFKLGVTGVLVGTVCAQVFNFFAYGIITYKYCFPEIKAGYRKYLLKNIYYTASFILYIIACNYIYGTWNMEASIGKFLWGGLMCEGIVGVMYLILNCKNKEMRELCGMFTSALKKKIKRIGAK